MWILLNVYPACSSLSLSLLGVLSSFFVSAFCLIFLLLFSTDVKLRSKSRKVDLHYSALRAMRMASEAIVLEQRKGMVEQWTSRDDILVHPQLSLKLYLMIHSMT